MDFDLSIIIPLCILCILLNLIFKIKFKKDLVFIFFFTIFYIYLCNVLKYTQFPIFFREIMREVIGTDISQNFNFIPLLDLNYDDLKTSLLNIVLTFPFGCLIQLFKKMNLKQSILIGFIFSVIIESFQLATLLIIGFSMRCIDINDLIFNVLGVVIGFYFYRLFRFFLIKFMKIFSIKSNIILDFIIK